jgi:hypothetical protein
MVLINSVLLRNKPKRLRYAEGKDLFVRSLARQENGNPKKIAIAIDVSPSHHVAEADIPRVNCRIRENDCRTSEETIPRYGK